MLSRRGIRYRPFQTSEVVVAQIDRYTDEFDGTEAIVYGEMQKFRAVDHNWLTEVKQQVNEPLEALAKKLEEVTGRDEVERVVTAIVDRLDDASSWTLDPDDVLESYREAGHPVEAISAIPSLDLRVVETVVDGLASRYRVAAFGEGAVTGAAGLTGALASLPAVASTAMRAIHEYGYYYGFDLEVSDNREHALLVLAAAASSGKARAEALERVSAYADGLHGTGDRDREVPTPTVNEIGERLAFRLGRGVLAQSLPLVGAAIGGGLDQKFLQNVCQTARHCYRERWLLREHAESSAE